MMNYLSIDSSWLMNTRTQLPCAILMDLCLLIPSKHSLCLLLSKLFTVCSLPEESTIQRGLHATRHTSATIQGSVAESISGGASSQPNMSRTKRRRPGNANKKGTAAASQPVPNNKEVVRHVACRPYHSLGEPILLKELSDLL